MCRDKAAGKISDRAAIGRAFGSCEFYLRQNVSSIKPQRNYCAFTNQKNAGRTMQGVTISHKPSFLRPMDK
jgi:hypothetical protein